MAVTLNKANLVLKDANGNIGKIEQLSDRDLTKIRTAVSDVALVVNQSNHKPIAATTTNKGVVQLATYADVASGAIDKVVTAEQLHNATTGTSALAIENLARIDAVVTEAGIPIDHTNTNQLKTAVTTLVNNAKTDASQKYLPLTGGTVKNSYIDGSDKSGIFHLEKENGANLYLFEADSTNYMGGAIIRAVGKDAQFKDLQIKNDGSLTWDNKNIVRSVNGINADNNGNVSITSVNHATSADESTNAYNLRTTSHADHFLRLEWGSSEPVFNCYVLAPNGEYRPVCVERAHSADVANKLKGYDNGNNIALGWDGNNLTMNVDDNDGTKGEVITHLNIGSQSVNHANTANEATNAYNLRTTSHADHFVRLEWDGTYFWTWVRGPNGEPRPVNVAHAISADNATNATKAIQDKNGNDIVNTYATKLELDQSIAISASGTDYIRFANGTQICWGYTTFNNVSSANITLPVPFANPSYQILCGDTGVGRFAFSANPGATTYFTVYLPNTFIGLRYIAIGSWK